jgi:hypothetical protein
MTRLRMSRFTWFRALAALLLVGAAGCRDQLPTAAGAAQFPEGALLQSATLDLVAGVETVGQFTGYTTPVEAPFGLVATRFDGGLDARTLIRLTDLPDSVLVTANGTSTWTTEFAYTPGQLVARVDTVATEITAPVTLRLMALTQEWDAATATWAEAREGEAWQQPGGTLGRELARASWVPRDTLFGDSVRWQMDSLTVAQVAENGFRGIAIVADGGPARMQLGEMTLRAGIRTAARPDTVLTRTATLAARTFIFTPTVPLPGTMWNTGGIGSTRTLFRVTLPDSVSACPPGAAVPHGAACPRRALREVALNEVSLLLRPQPVGGGFRPLAPVTLRLRSVAEPGLGQRAPLGPPIIGQPGSFAQATVRPNLFVAANDSTVMLRITQHAAEALARDTGGGPVSTALALLVEPEGTSFGTARFAAAPRLRIVYTLPTQQTSP